MKRSYFLAKTDPSSYPVSQFEADDRTVWDGVTNALALQAIRAMRPGDRVFIYHSGGESAVVGLARVTGKPKQDAGDAKLWAVEMEFTGMIEPPVTLGEIKASGLFAEWALVRQGRLSTMAAPESFAVWMRAKYPKLKL